MWMSTRPNTVRTGTTKIPLAIPSMLAQVVIRARRDFVMAVWSAYMPAGIMLMLLIGPLLPLIGWRSLWFANAAAAAGCSVLLALWAPTPPGSARESAVRLLAEAAGGQNAVVHALVDIGHAHVVAIAVEEHAHCGHGTVAIIVPVPGAADGRREGRCGRRR